MVDILKDQRILCRAIIQIEQNGYVPWLLELRVERPFLLVFLSPVVEIDFFAESGDGDFARFSTYCLTLTNGVSLQVMTQYEGDQKRFPHSLRPRLVLQAISAFAF